MATRLSPDPERPWVGKPMRCPKCGGVWAFDERDQKAIQAIHPVRRSGKWQIYAPCSDCRSMTMFTEVHDASTAAPYSTRCGDGGSRIYIYTGTGESADDP